MAVLKRSEVKEIAAKLVSRKFRNSTADMDLADIASAVQAYEDWIEANQASLVAATPDPFKSKTNPGEKALLFIFTLMKRSGILDEL